MSQSYERASQKAASWEWLRSDHVEEVARKITDLLGPYVRADIPLGQEEEVSLRRTSSSEGKPRLLTVYNQARITTAEGFLPSIQERWALDPEANVVTGYELFLTDFYLHDATATDAFIDLTTKKRLQGLTAAEEAELEAFAAGRRRVQEGIAGNTLPVTDLSDRDQITQAGLLDAVLDHAIACMASRPSSVERVA